MVVNVAVVVLEFGALFFTKGVSKAVPPSSTLAPICSSNTPTDEWSRYGLVCLGRRFARGLRWETLRSEGSRLQSVLIKT